MLLQKKFQFPQAGHEKAKAISTRLLSSDKVLIGLCQRVSSLCYECLNVGKIFSFLILPHTELPLGYTNNEKKSIKKITDIFTNLPASIREFNSTRGYQTVVCLQSLAVC
jgi:hypothetical protein